MNRGELVPAYIVLFHDELSLVDVNLKVRGWIAKLLVNKTGQRVQKGIAGADDGLPGLLHLSQWRRGSRCAKPKGRV